MNLDKDKNFSTPEVSTKRISRLFSPKVEEICPACGGETKKKSGKVCLVCGKLLSEGYQPLDFFKSSYNLHRKKLVYGKKTIKEDENLFEKSKNSVSETAWACVVYSMVPYIGILFIPLAFVLGGAGVFVAHQYPDLGGGKTAKFSLVAATFVLAVQLFLWWLLYFIPQLSSIQVIQN